MLRCAAKRSPCASPQSWTPSWCRSHDDCRLATVSGSMPGNTRGCEGPRFSVRGQGVAGSSGPKRAYPRQPTPGQRRTRGERGCCDEDEAKPRHNIIMIRVPRGLKRRSPTGKRRSPTGRYRDRYRHRHRYRDRYRCRLHATVVPGPVAVGVEHLCRCLRTGFFIPCVSAVRFISGRSSSSVLS